MSSGAFATPNAKPARGGLHGISPADASSKLAWQPGHNNQADSGEKGHHHRHHHHHHHKHHKHHKHHHHNHHKHHKDRHHGQSAEDIAWRQKQEEEHRRKFLAQIFHDLHH